jgi:hypothetical protein
VFGLGTPVAAMVGTCIGAGRRDRALRVAYALLAFLDNKFLVFRVPYPIGYFTKWMDGRVDDPNGGWKGKSLWSTYATRAMFHLETGKGRLRPSVLAILLSPFSASLHDDF